MTPIVVPKGKLMKNLLCKCLMALLWVGGWLLVNSLMLFDEISDGCGYLFRRRK